MKLRMLVCAGLLASFALGPPAALLARGLPSYTEAQAAMPAIWAKRYPVSAREFVPNPGGKGVLRAYFQGRLVYYYRFQAVVTRPVRGDDEQLVDHSTRTIEFWARYRSWLAEPWDLSFVREDRLPGTGRRWVQVGR